MRALSSFVCWAASCVLAVAAECGDEDWGVCSSGLLNEIDLLGSEVELVVAAGGSLGFRPSDWPPAAVFVNEITPGGLADQAGLLLYDEVLRVGGHDVLNLDRAGFLAAIKARPLHLSVGRHAEDATAEEFESRFMAKRCYIGGGDEFDWSPVSMTLQQAHHLCRRTEGCRAVSGNPGVGFKDGIRTEVLWHFRQDYTCFADPGWVTVAMLKDDEDEHVPPVPPFSPPSLDVWRSAVGATFLSEDPVIVQFDNFLSAEEADHIIDLGRPLLESSTIGMERDVDSSMRTSQTAWLDGLHHWRDPTLKAIDERIEQLTNVARRSMEHHQVLRYEPGQHYHEHHDYIEEQSELPCGPRVATFFMYLNDMPDGGATLFPSLGVKVQPVRGKAVLWWNFDIRKIQNGARLEDLEEDERVEHVAQPVVNGTKWAVNKWLHSGDFVNNHRLGLLFV